MSRRLVRLGVACIALILGLMLVPTGAQAGRVTTGNSLWYWLNPLPLGNDLHGASMVDAQVGWAAGDYGTIIQTFDGGTSWRASISGTKADLNDVDFVDASRGWAVGESGTILATTDGGSTWLPQESSTALELCDVEFVDAEHGWAVGGTCPSLSVRCHE